MPALGKHDWAETASKVLASPSVACHVGGMGKRVQSGIAIALAVLSGVIVWRVLHHTRDRTPSYADFLRTERLSDFFARYRFSGAYQTVSRVSGFNLAGYFRRKAQEDEQALLKSGGLVTVTFWAPWNKPLAEVHTSTRFIKVLALDEDTISVLCLPHNVAELQSIFCCITNRVPMAPLTRLAGFNAEEITCRLPDRTQVNLSALQKWLNDSVAAGWTVGVGCQYGRLGGQNGLLATRERPQTQTKPGDPPNRSSLEIGSSAGKEM